MTTVVESPDGTVFLFRRGCWAQAERDASGALRRLSGDCCVLLEGQDVQFGSAHARDVLHLLDANWHVRSQALVFLAACDLSGLTHDEVAKVASAAAQLPSDRLPWSYVGSQLRTQVLKFGAQHGLPGFGSQSAEQARDCAVGLVDV